MNKNDAGTWGRFGESVLLALALLAPLAAHSRTFDPSALRTALLEAGGLTLTLAFLLKGLARGRWEAASGAGFTLLPLAALAAASVAGLALSPSPVAGLPALAPAAACWLAFAYAQLELGGARHAARLAFWTAAAAALSGAAGVVQKLGGGAVTATLGAPESLAAFAAAALPVVLSLRLDPEATGARRMLSAACALLLGLLAGWAGSGRGAAAFALTALAFAAVAAALLRSPAARRAAAWALGAAALAGLGARASGAFWEAGRAPSGAAAALGWLVVAAGTAAGLRAAWSLRARGAVAEAGFAAALACAFGGASGAAAAGLLPPSGAGAFLAWAAGGVAAGLSPLSRPRSLVRALPIPAGADVRRLMQGPVFLLFAGAALWPGLWLASDVSYNRAVAASTTGDPGTALAEAGRVWPGGAVYVPSLYLRGKSAAALGRPADALAFYDRLDAVSPDYARVHARRAEAYAALGDLPSAARERAAQARRTPGRLSDLVAWCDAARQAGDLDSADAAAAAARDLSPDDPSVRTALAENALYKRRLAAREGRERDGGRRGTALRPKGR